jgi:hypothetical protein
MDEASARRVFAGFDLFWQVRLRAGMMLFGGPAFGPAFLPRNLAPDAMRKLWDMALSQINSDPENLQAFGGPMPSEDALRLAKMTPLERLTELAEAIAAMGITKAGRPHACRFDHLETETTLWAPGFWERIGAALEDQSPLTADNRTLED